MAFIRVLCVPGVFAVNVFLKSASRQFTRYVLDNLQPEAGYTMDDLRRTQHPHLAYTEIGDNLRTDTVGT